MTTGRVRGPLTLPASTQLRSTVVVASRRSGNRRSRVPNRSQPPSGLAERRGSNGCVTARQTQHGRYPPCLIRGVAASSSAKSALGHRYIVTSVMTDALPRATDGCTREHGGLTPAFIDVQHPDLRVMRARRVDQRHRLRITVFGLMSVARRRNWARTTTREARKRNP
jgi:hypothetical protein